MDRLFSYEPIFCWGSAIIHREWASEFASPPGVNNNCYWILNENCRWSKIAAKLPGRTDNEIKNIWHTYLKKRLEGGNDQSGYSPNSSPECCISAAAMVGTPAANNDHLKQEGIIVSSVAPVNVEPIKKEDSKSGQGMIVPSAAAAAEDLHDFESIPFDSDDDIWDLLDSLNTIADSDQFPPEEVLPLPPIPNELPKPEMKNIESGGEAAAARAESYKKWLKYLEIELGLDDDKDN